MSDKPRFRLNKLIAPGLQLRMIGAFLAVSLFALLFQLSLFAVLTWRLLNALPQGGQDGIARLPGLLGTAAFVTLCVLLPLTLAIGAVTTNKVAGPIYRFTLFLKQLKGGEKPADCRIREDDALRDFCQLLNEATAPQRVREEEPAADGETAGQSQAA